MSSQFARVITLALALSLGSALAACGGGDGGGTTPPTIPPPPPAATVTRIDLTSPTGTISVQQSVQLSATARLSDGSSNGAPSVAWSSSAANVATVSTSGLVTGIAPGSATITASIGTISGTASITVTSAAGVLSAVAITITEPTVQLGQTTQVTVAGRDALGGAVALGARAITWTSSSAAIATVSASGVITGVGVGTSTIQVSVVDGASTRTATAALVVTGIAGAPLTTDIAMPGLTFSPFEAVVKQGGTVRFIFPSLAHNVIWDPRLSGQPAAPTDIGVLSNTIVSRTFPNVGVFPYKCTLHPGMDGTIIVSP